jgi:phosphatidate cytidylyltransferase
MTRLISGALLAAAAVAAILLLPVTLLRVVACGVAALAAYEYVRVAGAPRGVSQWIVVAVVAAACWVAAGTTTVDVRLLAGLVLAWVAVEVLALGRTVHQAGVAAIAPAYIGVPLGLLVATHAAGGWQATLLLMGTVVVSDSAQYYSGRALGRHPLAPAISPKKTIEGAVGGLLFGTAFMAIAGPWLVGGGSVGGWVAVGAAVVFLGICGDLFESRLKRHAGVKDSSALIPGHGGVLDRIDALLFAIPAYYTYLQAGR